MRILFLEPFFGGSHMAFALGLQKYSRCEIELLTMAPRFWKWRMRGAALYFYKRLQGISDLASYDGILCSSLMSLADLKALVSGYSGQWLVYFHESQFDYPLSPGETCDYQFGFTNISTAAAADHLLFNSIYHKTKFFEGAEKYLRMMPDYNSLAVMEQAKEKSLIIYPGVEFSESRKVFSTKEKIPLVLWNHRWEHDKGFTDFFRLIDQLIAQNVNFKLALAGEHFQSIPQEFIEAKKKYEKHLEHYGYIDSFDEYQQLLQQADLVISTSWQENFGISIVEAMAHGVLALLPKRLSYPEILPREFHHHCLYNDFDDLVNKAKSILQNLDKWQASRLALSEAMDNFHWSAVAKHFDSFCEKHLVK